MALILLGAPGSGKGTQCKKLAEVLLLPHLSTGDMLRENIYRNTELGCEVKDIIEQGNLVSDSLVSNMLGKRIAQPDCAAGFILDGFPRTREQAQSLDLYLSEKGEGKGSWTVMTVHLVVGRQLLLVRLMGRQMCPACGLVYNARTRPAMIEGTCDLDGAKLIVREDDREAAVLDRLQIYEQQVRPIISYYSGQGTVVEIDGDREVEDVTTEILGAVRGLSAQRATLQKNSPAGSSEGFA